MKSDDGPPVWLAWIAAWLMPRLADEAALGDLDERYRDRAGAAGRAAATRWYARQLLGFLLRLPIARVREATGQRSGFDRGSMTTAPSRVLLLRDLRVDLRLAGRRLISDRSAAAATIATLAIGIGTSTAVYAVFNHTLFRPVPGIGDGSRLVSVYVRPDLTNPAYTTATHAHLAAMRAMPAFDGLAGYRTASLPVRIDGGDPRMLQVTSVSLGYFDLLDVEPVAGRLFTADEYELPGMPIAVISERLWRSALGGDVAAVGADIQVVGAPVTVVGVARSFRGLASVSDEDVWLPVGADAVLNLYRGGEYRWDRMVGRLQPGVTLNSAREQATAAFERIGRVGSGTRTFTAVVYPGLTDGFGLAEQSMTELFWLAISGSGLLLLLACANAAGMLIARNLRQQRDLALRIAIGASRLRIVRQLLIDTSTISAVAAIGGMSLAAFLVELFRSDRLMSYMPVLNDLTFDWRVAVFTALVATLTVLLAGMLPAILAARTAIRAPLQESMRRPAAGRLRRTLTAAQVALSLALVASAGVLAESVARLRSVDLGFDPERLLTVTLQPRLAAGANAGAFFGELERRLSAVPGIDAVGVAPSPPLGSYLRTEVMVSPEVPTAPGLLRYVSSDYFRAMRIPLVAGRVFTAAEAHDQGTGGPAIIDELVAQHLFGVASALGRSIHVRRRDVMERHHVVGVVGATAWSLHESRRPTVYLPVADLRVATFHVRSRVPAAEGMQIVRRVVRELDPLLVIDVQTIDSHIDRLTSEPRVQARLAAMLAIFALALAVVGVYSAASAAAQARTREFGIRLALGASRTAIGRDVVGGAGRTAAFGVAGGVLLYAWTSRYLESELHSISALDAWTIAVACGLLFTVAVGAAWLPARRAARVDPTVTLRAE